MASQPGRVQAQEGLEGVVAGTSAICFVDGAQGRLIYRGYDADVLAQQSTFEEVAYLLWHGHLPARAALDGLKADLIRAGTLPAPVVGIIKDIPKEAQPMAVLRTGVSALGHFDPEAADNSPAANARKALRLTAQIPALVGAFHRHRTGAPPLAPQTTLGHAGNYLYLLHGTPPDPDVARALDMVLILHADHEFNASTFSARVSAATLTDLHSAVTSAIGTLKGPLHGGANEDVMRLLQSIGSVDRVEAVITEMLAAKKKIPGFGHRVYRTEDPRARFLRPMSKRLGERAGDPLWYQLTRKVEDVTTTQRKIHANVDLYSSSVYRAMGIPMDLYTATFAVSRIAGWTAHVLEQYSDNRLIRPMSKYIGETDRTYVPLSQRS